MKRSSKALRMAQPLAVVAVWAGLLGYVIPAAFSTAPTVSAAASASSAASRRAPAPLGRATGSSDRKAPVSASARQRHRDPAMVRVMQAAPRLHRVCVTLGRETLSCGQAFASITAYRSVRPGTWTVQAAAAGEHAAARVTLAAGSRTTLVVLGGRRHLAISSAGVPRNTGARVSGGGPAPSAAGTTPKPGGSPVPWVVLGGTGLLLALAGLARLRQLRWARRVAAQMP
jgi:hypothetical protein